MNGWMDEVKMQARSQEKPFTEAASAFWSSELPLRDRVLEGVMGHAPPENF